VKLTLYAIIEALESHALATLGSPIDDEYLAQRLAKKRLKSIEYRFGSPSRCCPYPLQLGGPPDPGNDARPLLVRRARGWA